MDSVDATEPYREKWQDCAGIVPLAGVECKK